MPGYLFLTCVINFRFYERKETIHGEKISNDKSFTSDNQACQLLLNFFASTDESMLIKPKKTKLSVTQGDSEAVSREMASSYKVSHQQNGRLTIPCSKESFMVLTARFLLLSMLRLRRFSN